jgi:YggT family protein
MAAAVFAASPAVHNTVGAIFEIYVIVLIARALLSWFPVHAGSPLIGVVRVLDRLTEPVLAPIRRILPPIRAGGMAIDLSIIIAIIVVQIIRQIVLGYV